MTVRLPSMAPLVEQCASDVALAPSCPAPGRVGPIGARVARPEPPARSISGAPAHPTTSNPIARRIRGRQNARRPATAQTALSGPKPRSQPAGPAHTKRLARSRSPDLRTTASSGDIRAPAAADAPDPDSPYQKCVGEELAGLQKCGETTARIGRRRLEESNRTTHAALESHIASGRRGAGRVPLQQDQCQCGEAAPEPASKRASRPVRKQWCRDAYR